MFCRAMLKTIACAPNRDTSFQLDDETLDELHLWLTVDWSMFVSIWPVPTPGPTVEMLIDASAIGWGAWVANLSYQISRGFFSPEESVGSSTLREVLGLLFALRTFLPVVRN